MFALCNCAVAKLLIVLTGLLGGDVLTPALSPHVRAVGAATVCAPAPSDTTAAQKPQKSAKPEKPEKSTKITISDEGIKIESEGTKKVIFDTNGRTRAGINRKVIANIDDLKKDIGDLKNLPESLATVFGDEEDKRFYNVKSSDIVKVGQRIVIGPHDLVNGDVVAICSSVSVEGKVMGDVAAICGNVDLAPTAVVNGEVVSVLGDVNREDGSVVRGEVAVVGRHHHNRSGLHLALGPFGEGLFGAGGKVAVLIVYVLLMLIVLYFLARRMTSASDYAAGSFLKSFGVGLLILVGGTVLIIILCVILAITIVGIPVAVLLALSYAALFVLGYFVAALGVGRFVGRKFNLSIDSPYLHGILGLFLLSIIGIIASFMFFSPLFGPLRTSLQILSALINFVAALTGVGAFVMSRAGNTSARPGPAVQAENGEAPGRLPL